MLICVLLKLIVDTLELYFILSGHTYNFSTQGVCDGAGAIILASEEAVKTEQLTPLARLIGYSIVGVEPSIMGIGPAPAIKQLLKVTDKNLNDVELVEVKILIKISFKCRYLIKHVIIYMFCQINEAFGAQTLACARELDLDINKLNVDGGAIALGHPLAASGSRITAHLIHELRCVNI